MEKYFKLPKEFTENWLKELRSGNYEQLVGALVYVESSDDFATENDVDYKRACCLGVACVMLAGENTEIAGHDMPSELSASFINDIDYPEELLEDSASSANPKLSNVLVNLNDGYGIKTYELFIEKYPNLNIKKPERVGKIHYTFEEVADWIENNVELY